MGTLDRNSRRWSILGLQLCAIGAPFQTKAVQNVAYEHKNDISVKFHCVDYGFSDTYTVRMLTDLARFRV